MVNFNSGTVQFLQALLETVVSFGRYFNSWMVQFSSDLYGNRLSLAGISIPKWFNFRRDSERYSFLTDPFQFLYVQISPAAASSVPVSPRGFNSYMVQFSLFRSSVPHASRKGFNPKMVQFPPGNRISSAPCDKCFNSKMVQFSLRSLDQLQYTYMSFNSWKVQFSPIGTYNTMLLS